MTSCMALWINGPRYWIRLGAIQREWNTMTWYLIHITIYEIDDVGSKAQLSNKMWTVWIEKCSRCSNDRITRQRASQCMNVLRMRMNAHARVLCICGRKQTACTNLKSVQNIGTDERKLVRHSYVSEWGERITTREHNVPNSEVQFQQAMMDCTLDRRSIA